jgi:UDP-N-acetylmuramate--alanine ligase
VHFVGVAGAGMSALAELFVRRGLRVTGSDMSAAGNADLEALGVRVHRGHDASHVDGARAVVASSAIAPDHAELAHATTLGLPIIRRAEALGAAVDGLVIVGVAGTHGKTTTTVMATEALAAAGRAPTGIVGGRVQAWGGNLRWGGGDTVVVEADEYDRSFLALHADVAIVTNVEADHLDIYADLADIEQAFAEFASHARHLVRCMDDAGAARVPAAAGANVIGYGLRAGDGVRLVGTAAADGLAITFDGVSLGTLRLRVPGDHNRRNALAALGAGLALGATFDALAPGLEAFGGVERRFERKGEANGVLVIDDYAHHPTELRATLAAARAAYPGRRLVAAFQPHLYSRTRDFAADFGEALATGGDIVFLTDIYKARELPIPGVTSQVIADAAARAGRAPAWSGARADVTRALAEAVRPGDVVLTLGAGDITAVGPELLAALGEVHR